MDNDLTSSPPIDPTEPPAYLKDGPPPAEIVPLRTPFQVLPGGAGRPEADQARRRLPENDRAEESVIGGILFNGHLFKLIVDIVEAADFYHPAFRAIFEAMTQIHAAGRLIDLITVSEHLRAQKTMGKLASVRFSDGKTHRDEAVLAKLLLDVATVENIAEHAQIIRSKGVSRRIIQEAQALGSTGRNGQPQDLADSVSRLHAVSGGLHAWRQPQALTGGLLPVPALDRALIPESLRDWLSDVAERAQCPIEYPTVGALVAAGALIGRQLAIRPRTQDSWTEFANLWGAIIGPPGVLKSPALKESLVPLYKIQSQAWEDFRDAVAQADLKEPARRAKEKDLRRQIEIAALNNEPLDELEEQLAANAAKTVTAKRYITSDATIQKLLALIVDNPNGLLVHRDELRGLLMGWEKDGHEGDRTFYLEGWCGDGAYTADTISRGSSYVDGICLSVIGTIQPGPMALNIRATLKGGEDDGLLQRFQMAVYPDVPPGWVDIDRRPNLEARDRVCELYRRLVRLYPNELGADYSPAARVPFVRFSAAAQELAKSFRETLAKRLRDGKEHPLMVAHLSKFNKLFPALSLIIHLLDVLDGRACEGSVSHAAAQLALKWCHFLEAHARRIYGLGLTQDDRPAMLLASRIQAGELGDQFSLRDVYIRHWGGLQDKVELQRAATELVEAHWLREQVSSASNGRKVATYRVNPALLQKKDH